MNSKKARRKKAFLERQTRREKEKVKREKLQKAYNSGSMEEMAEAMGIKLR